MKSKNPKDIVRTGYDRVSTAYRGASLDPADPDFIKYDGWVNELSALLSPGAQLLDVGCGNGVPVDQLFIRAGFQVTGVDFSPVQIERARTLVPSAVFFCEDITGMGFPPGSFSAVVSFYAIIHIPLEEQPDLFKRIRNWLKPGGYLMVIVGDDRWTGIEDSYLGVDGGQMYWNHADKDTYLRWLSELGYRVLWNRFVPEGSSGHTLILARKEQSADPRKCAADE